MRSLRAWMCELWRDESGVTAVEYGLIAGLIGAVLVVAVSAFSDRLSSLFDAFSDRLEEAQNDVASPPPGNR